MTYTLRFLSATRFSGFLRWLPGEGKGSDEAGREATAIIQIHHPGLPTARPFYAKFYPDLAGRSRALANEVAGYVLADRWALPQPAPACILRAPLNKLDLKTLPKRHAWLKAIAKERTDYPAFCTLEINAPTPYHHFGAKAHNAMMGDVRRWKDALKTLTFDDIVANLDRHLNNLLRTGEARYALIDHGRLVVADGHWQKEHLDPALAANNRLLALLHEHPTEAANGMVAAADSATALLTGLHEVNHWLGPLLHNETERAAFHNFLQTRTLSAPQRIADRYALC
jgi:hypothetical protein